MSLVETSTTLSRDKRLSRLRTSIRPIREILPYFVVYNKYLLSPERTIKNAGALFVFFFIFKEKINESRTKKLVEYDKMKLDVAARKQELIRALDEEEKLLLDKIDEEVILEKMLVLSSILKHYKIKNCRTINLWLQKIVA